MLVHYRGPGSLSATASDAQERLPIYFFFFVFFLAFFGAQVL